MKYRIMEINTTYENVWVSERVPSGFRFSHDRNKALLFPSRFAAELAIRERAKVCGRPAEFGIEEVADPWTPPTKSYLFVGGPINGEQRALQEETPEFYVAISPLIQAGTFAYYDLSTRVSMGRAVYVRHHLGVRDQRHTVYVFSHVAGVEPAPDATIRFENATWRIREWTGEHVAGIYTLSFRATRSPSYPYVNGRLTGRIDDLEYQWDTGEFKFRKGATVTVNEDRTVTV